MRLNPCRIDRGLPLRNCRANLALVCGCAVELGPLRRTRVFELADLSLQPEQVRGRHEDLEISSDVYSLGVIGYELLCGEMPYDVRDKSITESV